MWMYAERYRGMSAATESISQQPRLTDPAAEDLSQKRATGDLPPYSSGAGDRDLPPKMPVMLKDRYGPRPGKPQPPQQQQQPAAGEDDGRPSSSSPSPKKSDSLATEEDEQHAAVRKHLSNGLGDASAFQDLTRHRLGLLRTDPNSNEASKLLRGILQGKEKRLQDSMNHFPHNGTLIGDPHSADSGLITKLLQQEREGRNAMRKNSFDSEDGSLSPDILSDNNSEHENNDQKDDTSLMEDEEDKEDKSRDECGSTGSNNDSLEAKRARVENIISGMRTSPSHADAASVGAAERKPKRKQYTPQQHANAEEPSPKARKVEKDVFEHQLKNMQQQLSEMQQRYFNMFEMEMPGMGHPEFSNYVMNLAENNRRFNEIRNAPRECNDKRMFSPENKSMTPHKVNLNENEMDPSHFLKEAGKLAKAQIKDTFADTPEDLENLAKMLKAELSKSVGTVVDDVFAKYVQTQKQQQLKKQQEQHMREQQQRQQQQMQQQQQSRTPMNERSIINVPEVSKHDKFPSPQMPHFARPFEDRDPGLNIPKPTKSKVTDKLIHPLIENHMRAFADLPRSLHHPLFPPPPYFPHGHLPPAMQPLFPKEPEQTEAIPLVVNTPKKKRTKVTDTRLSPRAARALLNEGSNGPLDFDKSQHSPHHHPLGFPPHLLHHEGFPHHPLVPVSLPTSVAIPNPSLQHSDVLAMYSHSDHGGVFGEGSRPASHSPIAADNGSPNMPHTPSEQSMPMSVMKAEDMFHDFNGSFSSEGTNIDGVQCISFRKYFFSFVPTSQNCIN